MVDHSSSGFGGQSRASCGVCGGDGRLTNSFGSVAKCPSCHGSGHRSEDTGFRDVTKTKESHRSNRAAAAVKVTWPTSPAGAQLAGEIRDETSLSPEVKLRLTREIIAHEETHAGCTQTFLKKIRKQVRPPTSR